MRRTLTGRSALVTGSTGGIGLALADPFAAEGCAVLLHGIATPEEGEALARAMAARHGARRATAAPTSRDPRRSRR